MYHKSGFVHLLNITQLAMYGAPPCWQTRMASTIGSGTKIWLGDARRMLRATCLGRKHLTSHTSQICTLVALSLLSSLPAMEAGEMVNANSYKQEW